MITDITLSGISLTGVSSGVDWGVETLQGWGSPGGTLSAAQKARADGGWGGDSFLRPRPIVLSGRAYVDDVTLSGPGADLLIAATSLASATLSVTESGLTRTATVRRDGPVVIDWPGDAGHTFDWSIQLVALDPRKFSAALTGSTGLPSSSGGLTYPYTYPYTYSTVSVSGQVPLTNPGNATGPVTLRIDGPVTGPSITHVGTSSTLTFSSSLVIGTGEYLLVDMERQQTLAQGQSSRDGYVTSPGFSGFDPGANLWSFAAVSGSGTLTVTATPAWL